ncbi:hypothetical protein FRB99_002210 [Tulasnella sp. 403]|nr:hypothetical protein FRB99_002210 [Tulasnella sp. 403]
MDAAHPVDVSGSFDLFSGTDPLTGKQVALRRFRRADRGYTDAQKQVIEEEGRKRQSFDHLHLLQFLGTGEDPNGLLYLVSPWVGTSTLWDYIRQHPTCDRRNYLKEAADGLLYLHKKKVIHGDVRAENVLVSTDGRALLSDVGLATILPAPSSVGLKGSSTVRFQSPELWEGQPRSLHSDMDQSAQNPRSMLRRLSPASVAQTTSSNSSARSSPVSVVAKAIKYLMAVKTAEALIVRINGEETLLIKLDSAQPFSVTGSFCDLFRGTDTYRRKYALKRCRFTDQPYADAPQQRIETEARRWQALTHDHLLRFLGMTKDKYGFLYLISPWIDNGSLQEYIMRNPGCDRPKYLYQVACALVYLHGEDIIHGDVRARNVLVSQSGDALLCDFGLAGIISLTGSVGLKGGETLRRDSPELWEGNPRSFKSDVYAFGMTIYEVGEVRSLEGDYLG